MPGKGDGDSPHADEAPSARYHIPGAEEIRRTARRVLRSGPGPCTPPRRRSGKRSWRPCGTTFRSPSLEEPGCVDRSWRLRAVRLLVHYTERPDLHPLLACPVCGSVLKPVKNRTLTGESVVLGQECTRCDYWTHRQRRVPVRYSFSRGGGPRVREPKA